MTSEPKDTKDTKDAKAGLTAAQRTEAEASIRSVGRRCRGPISAERASAVRKLLEEGKRDEASALDAASRPGCGYDVNTIVVEGPWDGQPHEYHCPDCGVIGRYVAPTFSADAAVALAKASDAQPTGKSGKSAKKRR